MQKLQDSTENINQDLSQPEPKMVCNRRMTVHPDYAIHADYQGRTIYFCTESCLNAFRADPERFYCAHSKPKS